MSYYIGIDLGTSAVKLILSDEKGDILKAVSKEYPIYYPHPGWSEQNPEDWFSAGHEYGIRDREFLSRGLDRILNFPLIYVKKK